MSRLKRCALLCALPILFLTGCNRTPITKGGGRQVVLYCSVDEVYAKPILKRIERETGLQILTVYDTEASKTTGLAKRIRAESARPRADVFWSSAALQALLLTEDGLIQPHVSDTTRDVPPSFRSQGGIWTSSGLRAHIIVYNAKLSGPPPRALDDLKAARFKNQIGISDPQFGTGSDWGAAIALRHGTRWLLDYLSALHANGVRVLPGNADVAQAVGSGQLLAGLCDTDDFEAFKKRYPALRLAAPGPVFPTVAENKPASETVLVPMPVVMIAGAPHPDAASKLVDALLSRATEADLVRRMPGVLPLRGALPKSQRNLKPYYDGRASAPEDYEKWPKLWDDVHELAGQKLSGN